MIAASAEFLTCINSPIRHIKGRVELYEGSTLLQTFSATDNLKSFKVERIGEENKLYGYGISQKLIVELLDKNREIDITKENTLEAVFGTQCFYTYTNPIFYVKDVARDENTNDLTITAQDALYNATEHKVSELNLPRAYTIETAALACGAFLGLPVKIDEAAAASFLTYYPTGANLSGDESVRSLLDAIAEATQTIYFINYDWELTFKRLDVSGDPVLLIDKTKYFTLENKETYALSGVCHATELGDNVIAGDESGTVQYIRNNPFWEMRDDIGVLVNNALTAVSGLTITQFDCSWRGNYLLEIGDKIAMVAKDNSIIFSYLLNDTMTYDGGLKQNTNWHFNDNKSETPNNPATLGDALKQTFARVDKANQQIELMASQVTAQGQELARLQLNTGSILATVERVEQVAASGIEGVNEDIATLTKKVEAAITAEDVNFAIQSELNNGVEKVITSTGFRFDAEGLTVSKSDSEMTTQITEDGMTVYRDSEAVLTADNTGVKAENLHATTYLIIGGNSRFEDYGNRTGCFWIGG